MAKMMVVPWLVILVSSLLLSVTAVNWIKLKNELNSSEQDQEVIKAIVKNWTKRPADFFKGITKESWVKIIPELSTGQIAKIRNEEFEGNKEACRAFSPHLSRIPNPETLPKTFRSVLYEQLRDIRAPYEQFRDNRTPRMVVKFIPPRWVEDDGLIFMTALMASNVPLLRELNSETLGTILKNTKNVCSLINVRALSSLFKEQVALVTPECVSIVQNLDQADLSSMVRRLPRKSFSKYNGSLSTRTLSALPKEHMEEFGSLIDDNKIICQSLDLAHLSASTLKAVSARCLYGYLDQNRETSSRTLNWGIISYDTMIQFTPSMRSVWANIKPNDIVSMNSEVRRLIFATPKVCYSMDLEILKRFIKDVSSGCFYAILSRPEKPISLGESWKMIAPNLLLDFSDEMMEALRNINVEDFGKMPLEILRIILNSEIALANLPQPVNQIEVSGGMTFKLRLGKQNFARIARAAPSIAIQLLEYSREVSPDILAGCDGHTIRSLNYYGKDGFNLEWNDVLKHLIGKVELYIRIVELMSTDTDVHFCSTVTSLEEYLSYPWLKRASSESCKLALGFNRKDPSVFMSAPEIALGEPNWKEILDAYSPSDWAQMNRSKENRQLFVKLGRSCEFLEEAYKNYPKSLRAIKEFSADPHCVYKLRNLLRDNVDAIPSLGPEAFALYQAGELPCALKDLSSVQIGKLSEQTIIDLYNPTEREIDRHVLSKIDLEELKPLTYSQFSVLLKKQSAFVSKEILESAVEWQFRLLSREINENISKLQNNEPASEISEAEHEDHYRLMDALELYLTIKGENYQLPNDLDIEVYLPIIKDSPLRDQFRNLISESPGLKALIVGLCRDVDELREFLRDEIQNGIWTGSSLELPFDSQTGFDRDSLLQSLFELPENFANPNAQVTGGSFIDAGGPFRILVDQLMKDIERDLIVPMVGLDDAKTTSESNDQNLKDGGNAESLIGNAKFVWGISKTAGLIVGLLMGKAFQLDLRLSFELDPAFYVLLANASEQDIRKYYETTYKLEISEFESNIRKARGSSDLPDPSLLEILTRPDRLHFTMLSTKVDAEAAKLDLEARANIMGGEEEDCFESLKDIKGEGFLEKYFEATHARIFEEFKGFVSEMVRGLALTLPTVNDFSRVSAVSLRPFAEFLPKLLNAEPINGKDITDKINFGGDEDIQTSNPDQTERASSVFLAFIYSLDRKQLEHFIAVWTGSSTLSLKDGDLSVTFISPDENYEPALFDFCKPASPNVAKDMPILTPGPQYLELFEKFTNELPNPDPEWKPDCDERGVKMLVGRASTCSRALNLYLQPAQSLFNSLVYILNTSTSNIRDG